MTSPRAFRHSVRNEHFATYTANICKDYVQANICILPKAYANDFLLFCHRNSAACPLLAVGSAGDWRLPSLGQDIDIRTDVPRYQVFKDGQLHDEPTDIAKFWNDDLVTFALGCSFSFEEQLSRAGIRLAFLEKNEVAGVYKTNLATVPAGDYHGPLIVTMRPFKPVDAIRAIQITSRFPKTHGPPIHIGNPALIGVDLTLRYQDIGSGVVEPDEIPLFWACGLTPQSVITAARIPLFITHAPSCMLITDLKIDTLAIF